MAKVLGHLRSKQCTVAKGRADKGRLTDDTVALAGPYGASFNTRIYEQLLKDKVFCGLRETQFLIKQ